MAMTVNDPVRCSLTKYTLVAGQARYITAIAILVNPKDQNKNKLIVDASTVGRMTR